MSADFTEDEIARLDADLADRHPVRTIEDIAALSPEVRKILLSDFDDVKARAIAAHAPEITSIFTDGNNRVTDAGVRALASLRNLKDLDLEWSAITDAALPWIAQLEVLECLDLGFTAVTPTAVRALQASRPKLDIDYFPLPSVGD